MGVDFRAKKLSLSVENRKSQGLPAKELWKGEKKSAEDREGSLAVSAFKSDFGVNSGDKGGGSGDNRSRSRGRIGLFVGFVASSNGGSSSLPVSILKPGSDENFGGSSDGFDGGRGGFRGNFDLIGVVGGSRSSRYSSPADSGLKSGSVGNYGGGGGGFCGGGGLKGCGFGMGGGIYFPTWEKPLLNIVEEQNRERAADKLKKSPKMLAAVPTVRGIEPLVLRRPLVDIIGARLQIGMTDNLKKLSVLLVEGYGDGKVTERDATAQVAPLRTNPPGGVGTSLALETIIELSSVDFKPVRNEPSTSVLVCSRGGGGLLFERMELAAELWDANIKAQFVPVPDPSLTEQYEYASEHDIKCLVIIRDPGVSQMGSAKVRHLELKKEREVQREDLTKFLTFATETQFRNPSLWTQDLKTFLLGCS